MFKVLKKLHFFKLYSDMYVSVLVLLCRSFFRYRIGWVLCIGLCFFFLFFVFLIKVGIPLILTVNSANIQDGIPLSILQPMPAGEGVGS